VALVALLLPGCATGQVNLWPVFFHETRNTQTPDGPRAVTTTEVLYPFFSAESEGGEGWYAVRPIYNYQWSARKDSARVQYLWPLGLDYRESNRLTDSRLWPFFAYQRSWSPLTLQFTTHAHLLQLIRWGRDDENGPYFAVIPLGGVTHGVIGDTWSFVLFPLYSHYRHGNYVRDDAPWPFFGYGRTPDGMRHMYRLWPFYVYQRQDYPGDARSRQDLPWPLVRWGSRDAGGEHWYTITVVSPFFSLITERNRAGSVTQRAWSVLGVSFITGARKEAGSGWSALWSLVRGKQGDKTSEFRIFPFYWHTTYYTGTEKDPDTAWDRYRVPWPLLWVDSDRRDPQHHKGGIVVVPLYWHYTDILRAEDGQESARGRRITLFPLFTWESGTGGDKHFWMLSHGWRDDSQGFKRNYRAFFDLFQYHRAAEGGEAEVRLVWRLYHQRRTPQGRYFSVAGLFTYDSTGEVVPDEGSYWSALFGLVKRSWSERGRRWRILFIPVSGGGSGTEETHV
jgi:hypothetical protein